MSIKQILYAHCPHPLLPYWNRAEASVIGYRLAKGVFWSIAGTGISRGLLMLAMILVARMLGKTAYGELGMIYSTVGMFGVFAEFGLGVTSTKYVSEYRQRDPARAGRIIGLSSLLVVVTGGCMALVLFIFAPWLSEHAINAPHLGNILRISAIILFLNAFNVAQTGALAGLEAFKSIARVNLYIGLAYFPILVGGVYLGELAGALWALAVHTGITGLLNYRALRREAKHHSVPITFKGYRSEKSIIWAFVLPAVLSSILFSPINWICNAMLVNQPGGYDDMGVYNAANQWYATILFLPGMLGSVMLPILSERIGQGETLQSKKLIVLLIKITALFVFPLVFLGCIASPYIMSLYGEGFRRGWPTLVVVLLTGGLLAIQTPVGYALAASARMWINFTMTFGWGLIFIIATWLLLDFGSLGLALARAASYIFHVTWTFAFVFFIIRKAGKLDIKNICYK